MDGVSSLGFFFFFFNLRWNFISSRHYVMGWDAPLFRGRVEICNWFFVFFFFDCHIFLLMQEAKRGGDYNRADFARRIEWC